jgi:hypothetical protein
MPCGLLRLSGRWGIKIYLLPLPGNRIPLYVRFEVFTAVPMNNAVFWDIKPFRTSQERHYFCATEPGWLMLCKFSSFHGVDQDECRLLGYKTPVLTSQETHYISTTETNELIICKIWDFQCGDYEPSSGVLRRVALVFQLLVFANVLLSSPILTTLMMEELRSSETSGHIRAARRNISEDGILRTLLVQRKFHSYAVWTLQCSI